MKCEHHILVCQVFQLLTDLKEEKKDSGKGKHSTGQQNLNTIMYEVSSLLPSSPSLCDARLGWQKCSRSVFKWKKRHPDRKKDGHRFRS